METIKSIAEKYKVDAAATIIVSIFNSKNL